MTAIEVKGLTKTYKIYRSPVDRLKEIARRKPYHSEFTALDNISFSVEKGGTFGVIGENGAGKSTLLKILARTLKPTAGHLSVNGRCAALLELGAGFNPEFTGEENIYLNAYLLGLSKSDIEKNKSMIIDFSELGDFIKRPVKTYSSGMHVRLAFSIATCVNPEILIVDEALSVGDQHFQKKCIDRMMRLREEGKTILFCSHSMYLVQELCGRSIWLRNGRMEKHGETSKVINAYNDWVRTKEAGMKSPGEGLVVDEDKARDKVVWVDDVKLIGEQGYETTILESGRPTLMRIRIGKAAGTNVTKGHVGIGINRNDEEAVYGVTTKLDRIEPITFSDGHEIVVKFSTFPLLAGQYYITVVLTDGHALHPYDIYRTEMFSVENLLGDIGIVRMEHSWELGG